MRKHQQGFGSTGFLLRRRDDMGGGQRVLSYDQRIHMFYNIDAVLHFEKSVPFHGMRDSEAQ